jgi:flagellar biosynthetic protein FliP
MPLSISTRKPLSLSAFFRRIRISSAYIGLSGVVLSAVAQTLPKISLSVNDSQKPADVAMTLQILFLVTILALAPSIMIMVTSFVRIIIVFSFLKRALGTQTMPPDQTLVGLALFMTFFIMAPVFTEINNRAVQPYLAEKVTFSEGIKIAAEPVRAFMLRQVNERDVALFLRMSKAPAPRTVKDLPFWVIVPAFITSELKIAFIIGFLLYIPFLVIDMVVASVLLSMGMMMLPPIMISLPFKIILFVLIDGWTLLVQNLVMSFH